MPHATESTVRSSTDSAASDSAAPSFSPTVTKDTVIDIISDAQKTFNNPHALSRELLSTQKLYVNSSWTRQGLYDASGRAWIQAQSIAGKISKDPSTLKDREDKLKSSIKKSHALADLKCANIDVAFTGDANADYRWSEKEEETNREFYDLLAPTLQFETEWEDVLSGMPQSEKLAQNAEYLKSVHQAGKAFRED